MSYEVCPKCTLNPIRAGEEMCQVCKNETNDTSKSNKRDKNKEMVENYVLPYLRELSDESLRSLTTKEESLDLFKLRLPLLVECKGDGKESCRKETHDDHGHGRYYVNAYDINGKKYHICSQWWGDSSYDNSKLMFKVLEMMKEREKRTEQ